MSEARGGSEGFTVLPSVDISGGRCVRVLQGRFGSDSVYSDDPVEVAIGFCSAGARWLHVVDLDGARTGIPANRELVLEVVRRVPRPVQAGGGVTNREHVEELLAARATRVLLTAAALNDDVEVAEICKRYGERIAVSLDVTGGHLEGDQWKVGTGAAVTDVVAAFEDAGASRFVYTDVSRDGTMKGPDLEGLARVTALTRLPVVAAGGISSLDELRAVARMRRDGVAGAIVGRALYDHKFHLGEAIHAADGAASEFYEPPLVEG
ncbi:MAG: phosphoribosylformimino-5-aminoimidazole carboxamide ribotide isomerase [Actinomycetota bacterium]|nr:phosphoribosylformimino-5-aminoimidazole carboxamide ribotide isomerase [Actinomycetota bacterium]